MISTAQHIPVMPQEVLGALSPQSGGSYLDGTVGGGGHARLLLEASTPNGHLLAVDRDDRAISRCREVLAEFGDRVDFIQANFCDLDSMLPEEQTFDGILLDLGVSSFHLDDPDAGFSFRLDGPLDMRMDRSGGATAADLVNSASETELINIIGHWGEERFARRVARAIIKARDESPIERTLQLADIVRSAVPRPRRPEAIDSATRTFQGLRIAVNDELSHLEICLKNLANRLAPNGRMAVISFHSLEDRIVKWAFRELAGDMPDDEPRGLPVMRKATATDFILPFRKPVVAGENEVASNPRSRSAKLRVLQRREANDA